MKTIITTLSMIMLILSAFAQSNFVWDETRTDLDFDKAELYEKTKDFIAKTWDESQTVIQKDNPDEGIIVLKGVSVQHKTYEMDLYKWTYAYTTKFAIDERKVRIVIDNAYCADAQCSGTTWPLMPVAEDYPSSSGLNLTGVNQDRYTELMSRLRDELQSIVDRYMALVSNEIYFQSE